MENIEKTGFLDASSGIKNETPEERQQTILISQYGGEESDVLDALIDLYKRENGGEVDSFYSLQQEILGGIHADETTVNKEAVVNKLLALTYQEFLVDMQLITGGVKNRLKEIKTIPDQLTLSFVTRNHLQELSYELSDISEDIETENPDFIKWLSANGFKEDLGKNVFVSSDREIVLSFSHNMVTAIKTPIGGQNVDIPQFIKHFDRNGYRDN